MCRATMYDEEGLFRPARRLELRAFYLRLAVSSSTAAAPPPGELRLVYHPAIGGAALSLRGRALPPAAQAEVKLLPVGDAGDGAYASADRVSAAEGARFEVYAGKELAADGVFARRPQGGWRVECRRAVSWAAVTVAEVVVLAEGGALLKGKARAASPRSMGCCGTKLEGIPEEEADFGCGEGEWQLVGEDAGGEWKGDEEMEMETVRWALEMGAWAVCVGVGLLATARRFRRKRAFR